VLIDGLRTCQPDLIAFQEAITTNDYDQTTDLLGLGYHVAHQTRREGSESGCAIASRWPLGDVHEVDLHVTARTASFPCVTLIAEIRAPDPFGPLLFVNHFPNFQLDFERERELQAVVAAQFIEQLTGGRRMHVLLAGDFSASPDSANVRFWCGYQSLDGLSVCYRDAWASTHPGQSGHTFAPCNPLVPSRAHPLLVDGETPLELGRRIDYIFVRCEHHGPTLDISNCELLFNDPIDGVWASDHFGVLADFSVPAAGS
jgi:endonuclease/exonuclease/phosphatase family metal-dependent hydrolase